MNSINQLNEMNASGPDKILITILNRNGSNYSSMYFPTLYNNYTILELSQLIKTANVVPILKKGDLEKTDNY